ncbi:MAG: transporter [Bdellovibrionales bacterium]|nr:transporter [Bdellovibrionales bacterium]
MRSEMRTTFSVSAMAGLATIAVAVAGIAPSAHAGGLLAPFSFDTAGVMPKGVRGIRIMGFTTEIQERWDGAGGYEPLANKFNKPITFGELADGQPEASDRAQLKGLLMSKDIPLDSIVGDARGVANARLTSTIPVAAYGLTDRLTVAAVIPVIYSRVNVMTGWASNENFQAVLDGLSAEGRHNKKLSFEEKLHNVVATKLAGYGYRPLENEINQEIGDVTLGAKYLVHKDDALAFAVSSRVVIPTGRQSSVEKLIDIAPGDGQWDVGLGATVEYQHSGQVASYASLGGLYQIESRRAKRVPIVQSENATPDIDFDVEERLGASVSSALGLRYKPFELWTVGAQYSFQYKGPDTYSGRAFAEERYQWMSNETEQDLQAAQVGLTFSTIPLFQKGAFPAPLETTLSFATSLGGRNTNKIAMAAWELALFF